MKALLHSALAAALTCSLGAVEEIPKHRAHQILDACPVTPSVKPRQERRVLIWNTPNHLMQKDPHKGYCIPYGNAALLALGQKTGAFEPVSSQDLAMFLPENLGEFDAVVMNNSSGRWIIPTETDLAKPDFQKHGKDLKALEQVLRQSLLDYISSGKGLVLLHYAIAANPHWPEFQEMTGGKFIGHPWNEEIGVTVEEPDHPLVAAFGGKDFRIADEIYEYGDPYDRAKVRVLLSLDPARSNMGVRWIHRKDNDFALAWVKNYGNGRVFNTSFGHRTELFWDARILQFYLDAVQYATGDLPAPTSPRPGMPERTIPGTEQAVDLPGFVKLFNGRDLAGWSGDGRIWSVQEGAITGETTAENRVTENTFLLWKDEIEDFELRLKFKLQGGNSGIYYRAAKRAPGATQGEALVGAQADISADGRWTGVIMEYTLREILAERGQKVMIQTNGQKEIVRNVGDPARLLAAVRTNDWNDYRVLAKGGRTQLEINGVEMSELEDHDPKRHVRGRLGLQVHTGPPMKVQFKEIYFKRLER